MRILAATFILLMVVGLPQPAAADHDSGDQYVKIGSGNDAATLYIDDSFPPMIYRESNNKADFQRGWDGSSHLGHSNPDQRLF